MAKRRIPKMIKFYQYDMGNNRIVGNQDEGYTDEVPKWYRLQASLYGQMNQGHHQLAGEEDASQEVEKTGDAGETREANRFWEEEGYEDMDRLSEGDWQEYAKEHDIFLPGQAQSDIQALKDQGLI